MIKGQFAVQKS
uniref:Uncharacterized protein n=1 Tax=Rhizophora mucronata TaxID=61149 RepID=A0A2P2QYG4_RHIMU